MPLYSIANNATTTLNGNINNSTTTLNPTSSSGFPSSGPFVILVDSELMLVTAGNGTTTWTVTRGIESTTASSHSSGATIANVVSAGTLTNNYVDLFSNQTIAGAKVFSTLPTGLVDTSSTQTLAAKTINQYPKVQGVGAGIVGGTPSGTAAFQIQAQSTVVTTSSSGGFGPIVFPTAFTNGVLSVVACHGDNGITDIVITVTNSLVSASQFSGQATHGNNVPVNAGTIAINWIAVGW